MKEVPASPRKTPHQIALEESLAVKAQAKFQAKRRLEEEKTRKELEAKRKRDKEMEELLLKDINIQPPPPPKVVKVARKTVLIWGKMKRQASKEEDILLNAAETLAGLNNSAIPADKGGDDSDSMSSSQDGKELNNAKKFEESLVGSESTCSGTSWSSNANIASAVAKKRASKSVKPKSFAVRNRAALAAKRRRNPKQQATATTKSTIPPRRTNPKIHMTRILPLVEATTRMTRTNPKIHMTRILP